jgi:murein DD-endopeptidase MepM/ murein hydrolase activator NlpD
MPMHHPTPRYTGVVMPAAGMPAATTVTPLRGATPARPLPAQGVSTRSRRAVMQYGVPVQARPWQVLLVPPTPGARTRAFALARWQARAFLGGLVMLLLLAASAVTAVIVALDNSDSLASNVEVASLRERVRIIEDSLTLARAVLADNIATASDANPASAKSATGGATAATARRTAAERMLARPTASAFAGSRAAIAGAGMEGLPVIGAIVSGFSNARRHPLLHVVRPHLGIDIAAARGTLVSAPAAGRVTYGGRSFALGLTLEIAHAAGISTRYAHLRSALVHVGDEVTRGAAIATVGSSGLTTGPHLHYEVAVNGRQVNPARFRMPQVNKPAAVPIPLPAAGAGAAKDDSASRHR